MKVRRSLLVSTVSLACLFAGAACSSGDRDRATTDQSSTTLTSTSSTTSSTSSTVLDPTSTTTTATTATTAPPAAQPSPSTTVAAATTEDVDAALKEAATAWVNGDQTLAGRAAPDAAIALNDDPDIEFSGITDCELDSSGTGRCEFLTSTPDGGYALIWILAYHDDGGRIVVDSLQFGGDAG